MRLFTRFGSGIAVLMGLAILAVGPASAAGAHQPDGWVRVDGYHGGDGTFHPQRGAWKGKNIYTTTARKQKATYDLAGSFIQGDYIVYTANVQNDGSASDRFKLHGSAGLSAYQTVTYFHGSKDITAGVVAGTFKTSRLSPGSSYQIQIRTNLGALVTITSVGDPSRKDAVKAAIKYACGC